MTQTEQYIENIDYFGNGAPSFLIQKRGYFCNAYLPVVMTEQREKAVKFTVVRNTKCSFWVPKAAMSTEPDLGVFVFKKWFAIDQFVGGMFERYGDHFNR